MTTQRKPYSLAGSKPLRGSEFTAINQLARQNAPAIVKQLLPGGYVTSKEYIVRNPKRADKRAGSFKICVSGPKAGFWSDFAANAKGRDLVSLVGYVKSLSRSEAARWLRANIMRKTESEQPDGCPDQPAGPGSELPAIAPVPESEGLAVLPPAGAEHPAHALKRMGVRIPDMNWTYLTADGATCHYVCRWNEGDGSKKIRPLSWVQSTAGEGWAFRAWPEGRPLYHLDKIVANPEALIIICEGEKAADAAGKLYAHVYGRGVVATTSCGGAGAVGKTDWTPLTGRTVLIWPDADEAGLKYAGDGAKRLEEIACNITVVDVMALAAKTPTGKTRQVPKGWDAADAVAEWTDRKALRKAISRVAKPYDPGPAFISFGPYKMTEDGLTVGGGGAPIRVSASFEVLGESRNPNGTGWGKWLRFVDRDGRVHTRIVLDADLQGDSDVICGVLAGEGLTIHPDGRKSLQSYLAGVKTRTRVTVVPRTGWHVLGDRTFFVLPNETIGAKLGELVILETGAVGPYASHGTLEGWISGVAKLAGGHHLPMFAVSMAFAGPLLSLANEEGGGVNLFGGSSTGKTTMGQAAASVWGRGSTSGGFVKAWRTTGNALGATAASVTDTLLVLDEISVIEGREAGAAIYGLANGTDKARLNRDASLKETRTWRLMTLSTGELPMEIKVSEDKGRKALAGQTVRMNDIFADRQTGHGAFNNAGGFANAGELADALKDAAVANYGVAGPEFVRRIYYRLGIEEAKTFVREKIKEFVAANVPVGSDGQVIRVATRFGLIAAAGELATQLGMTGWKRGRPTFAAASAFKSWLNRRGGVEATEIRQAVAQVRLFIEQFGESRFDPLSSSNDRPANNRAGWRTGFGSTEQWLIPPEIWKSEVCHGLDPNMVARTLAARQMLKRAADGFQSVVKIEGTSKRVYVITARIFEGGTEEAE